MDEARFDSWAKSLADGLSSRRTLLRALTVGSAAASFGAIWSRESQARKKKGKGKKKKQTTAPPTQTQPPPDCVSNCAGKVCGLDNCARSCGSCGPSQTCVAGACCPIEQVCGNTCCLAGTQCTNPQTSSCVNRTATNPDPICAGIPSCCSTRQCGDGCLCQTTIEGGGFCYRGSAPGCGESCTSSDDCTNGVCISYAAGTTCGANVCCGHRPAVCVPNSSRCDAEPTSCSGGQTPLANGSCATACTGETCGTGCKCFAQVGGPSYCVSQAVSPQQCDALPDCTITGDCLLGSLCIFAACTPEGTARNRCWPLCGG
jgi:hypothetical protein